MRRLVWFVTALLCTSVASVALAATCKDAGGICVEYSAICDDYKGKISKDSCPTKTDECCIVPKVATPKTSVAPAGFLSLELPRQCIASGNCSLDDIVRTGAAFANLLTAFSAALFFGTFVYGGARYLLSFGDKSSVEAGKKAMTGAAIGMTIVIGAWTLVNYVANAIQGIK